VSAETSTISFGRATFATAAPLAIVVGLFGVSFGVLSVSAGGIGAVAAVVMSATTYAGSAQFAAAAIVASGGQPLTAIVAALLLNARYIPIGVSVARFLPGGPLRRFAIAQLVIDESWALSSRGDGTFDARVLVRAGALIWVAWVTGTLAGVIGGEALGDPAALGLDAAFPALFLALLVGQLRSRRAIVAAALGAVIALALIPWTPAGVPLIAAAAAALVGLIRR
jgi:4-azaleucine resistance transporter AzlC